MRLRWTRFLALAFVPCAVACIDDFDNIGDGQFGSGPDCASLCERLDDCESEPSGTDCTGSCRDAEEMVRREGCQAEWEDLLDCLDDLSDICAYQRVCETESERVSACISDDCLDSGDDC
jgi:hypothetical protein